MMTSTKIHLIFKYVTTTVAVLVGLYVALLGVLTTSAFQAHVVYLHKIQMICFKDPKTPETFGFLRDQTTTFSVRFSSPGGLISAQQGECTIHEFHRNGSHRLHIRVMIFHQGV